jgi:ABC-2 type transport system permease protein
MDRPGIRRLVAIIRKEFRHIWRDRLSLAMLVFIPALLLVLYGYALSFDVKHLAIAVVDYDHTPASRALCDSMFQNPYFDRNATLPSSAQAKELLDRGAVRAVLVIPRDFERRLAERLPVRVQLLVDASDANTANAAIGYLDALADRMSAQIRADVLYRAGLRASLPVVTLKPRIWFNPELESARFLVPGLIGMLLMLAAVVATALSIVREKERETMEQIRVSAVRPAELIAGKTLPYVFVCLATMCMILLLGWLLFGVSIRGSLLLLALTTFFFLFAALGMGILISTCTRSQQMAFQIAILSSLLPAVILSGLIFPIASMPWAVQALSRLVIPRYFVAALRAIILKGAPLGAILPQLAGMLALGLLFNVLAAARVRREA